MLAVFIDAILVLIVFILVWSSACVAATLPIIVVVCSSLDVTNSARVRRDAALPAFDFITILWIRLSSNSTRVNSMLIPEVVDGASDS